MTVHRERLERSLALVWHVVALAVFVFALVIAYALATGQLDPLGFPYYGVASSTARTECLFILLAVLEAFCVIDALALGRRRRNWRFRAALGVVVLIVPLAVVISIAHVDLWRYDRHTQRANVVGGALMVLLIGVPFAMRHWAWRLTTTATPSG